MSRPELWAGLECTVNRVGDRYFDEVDRSGHARRLGDLERFASLGIRTMRYPILWERTAPEVPESRNWVWADERLSELRRIGMDPIVGLLHHGSGPRYTSLLDPSFPELFADFAGAVARRYPWVEAYTPINEPLTTARFSGLYGHWYPHGRSDELFARALVNQMRATMLAMQRIRTVNPNARLVQTDDLGRVYSTEALRHQAEFENDRRWLGWDLLCGRVNRRHPLFGYLAGAGVSEADLEFFESSPCPPDIVGINHYITSERFLDHRLDRYPSQHHGGNGRDRYADVEAVRVSTYGTMGHAGALREAWDRYRLPVALTEVHIGCSRGEQLRWLRDGWRAACEVRAEGVDVRAATVWAILGAYDWANLRTEASEGYEAGAFDVRSPEPRETAIAAWIRSIASDGFADHPVLDTDGWWHRPDRRAYPPSRPAGSLIGEPAPIGEAAPHDARFILITGATGTLGRAFAHLCGQRGLAYRLSSRQDLDIADSSSVVRALRTGPWAVVNAAGYVRVDDAEREPELCYRENTEGPAQLARACGEVGIPFLTFSSDLVFDGECDGRPYLEDDEPRPLSVYGATKAEAERRVLELHTDSLVVRSAAFFGPWDAHNFLTTGLAKLAEGSTWSVDPEGTVSPCYVPDLVDACLDLLIDGERGIWHLANEGAVSWREFAHLAALSCGLSGDNIEPQVVTRPRADRPVFSALGSRRGKLLPPLEDAIHRYVAAASPGAGRQDPHLVLTAVH